MQRGTSYAERRRRKVAVDNWTRANCIDVNEQGQRVCICPDCEHMRTAFAADHVTPIAYGGGEDGPLRVHCRDCSNRQGDRVSKSRRRSAAQ